MKVDNFKITEEENLSVDEKIMNLLLIASDRQKKLVLYFACELIENS